MTKNWVTKTPSDLSFALKLWQKFTHPKKIGRKNVEEEWESITQEDFEKVRTGLEPLADAGKLSALLLQYPPGLQCTPENMETVERTLRAFADYPKVVELRHKSWSRIAPRRIGFSKRIERARPLSTNRSFLFPSDKSLNQSAIYSTSERMAEMQRHGGNMRESWERYDYLYSGLRSKK